MKVLHCADFHFRDKDIDECRKVANFLTDYATDHADDLDLIIIAGDLTDRNDIKVDSATNRLLVQTVQKLADAAPVVICIGTPSHEGLIPEILPYVKAAHGITVSSRPEQLLLDESGIVVRVDDPKAPACTMPKAILSMVPTPTKQFFESADRDLFGSIEDTDKGIAEALTCMFMKFGMVIDHVPGFHIIVGHFQVGGAYVSETQQLTGVDIEISKDQIMMARPDLVCMGHIHKAQQIGTSPIFYSGSLYRKDFGEMDTKGFYVYTLRHPMDYPDVKAEFIEVPTRKLVKYDYDFDLPEISPEQIMSAIAEDSDGNKEAIGSILRLEIKAWQDHAGVIDKEKIAALFPGAESIDIRIIPVPRQNARAVVVLEADRLRDKIKARAELANEAVDIDILDKADLLEDLPAEVVLRGVE